MISLYTKSPDDQVIKTALANIGKELGTARDAIHYALGKDWDTHVGIRSMLVTNFLSLFYFFTDTRIMINKGMVNKGKYCFYRKNKGIPVYNFEEP